MKQTNTSLWSALMLASIMAAAPSTAMAVIDSNSAGAAPRPENYASYSLYIQALFNYQKMQDKQPGSAAEKLCRSDNDAASELQKKNACSPQTDRTTEAGNDQYESLEDAISKNPAIADSSSAQQRSTFRSFPLSPIETQDLSQMGVAGLLGLFNNLILQSQTSDSANQQINSNNQPPTNTDSATSNDLYSLLLTQIVGETLAMGGNIILRDGSGHAEVTTAIVGSGLELQISSNVRTGVYIVDRDGYPGGVFDKAGAVVISSLGINVDNLLVNIQGTNRSSSNPNLLGVQVNSPNAITVDLSGTTIGVADAFRDGHQIGKPTNFLRFGSNSVLTISPGMSLHTAVSRPNGMTTPFATLNGSLGSVTLRDISLLEDDTSVFNIGSLSMSGINLVNTKIFIDGQKIIVDAGTGITDASISLERMLLGDNISGAFVGDLYVNRINLGSARMSVEPH